MKNKPRRVVGNYPLTLERATQAEYIALIKPLIRSVRDIAQDEYLRIKDVADDQFRQDGFSDELNKLRLLLVAQISRFVSRRKIKSQARRAAKRLSDANSLVLRRQITRQIRSEITSIETLPSVRFIGRNEPWLRDKVSAFAGEQARLIQNLSQDHISRIEGAVFRGVSNGFTLKQLTEEIRRTGDISENRARLIARDQTSSLNSELTRLRQIDAGVKNYIWSTSLDERVRSSHASLEGRTFAWNDPPSVGHPGDDFQCRCVALPVFDN